jgi:hypothetical protein
MIVLERILSMEMLIDFPGGARVDAHFGPFTVRTDQPPYGGGEGSAPTPFARSSPPSARARGYTSSASAASAASRRTAFNSSSGWKPTTPPGWSRK